METIILSIIEKFGYLGIFLLIAIENIFPPIPSEVILLFGGFMTTYTKLNFFLIIFFSTLGSVIGALILYRIGVIINKDRLKLIVEGKVGKMLKLKLQDIEKADSWFEKKGNKTVLFCRCIPILRSLISIPAGMNKMNIIKFLFYTTLGSLIWNSILLVLGLIVGENWINVANIFNNYSNIVLIVLLLLIIFLGIMFYIRRTKKE